jgi:hypothetical protein
MPEKEYPIMPCPACGKTPIPLQIVKRVHSNFQYQCCGIVPPQGCFKGTAAINWNSHPKVTGHAVDQIKELKTQVRVLARVIQYLDDGVHIIVPSMVRDGLALAEKILSEEK